MREGFQDYLEICVADDRFVGRYDDLSLSPDRPPEVVKAFAAMQLELSVELAARQHEQAVMAEKDAFISELKELIEKLEGHVHDYRRTKFGPKTEKLDPAQMELALEDIETAIAEHRRGSPPSRKRSKPAHPIRKRPLLARSGRPVH